VALPDALRDALALHRSNRLAEAEELYRAILAAMPQQFDALHMLGVVATQRGRLQEGSELIARALAVKPDSAEAHANLANIRYRLGRHDEALAESGRALAIDARSVDAMNTRGLALHALERHAEALACYDRALALSPRHAIVLLNRGNALAAMERADDAIASYDAAIASDPSLAQAWQNRGNALRAVRRWREALASYDRALASCSDPATLHCARAGVMRDLGLHEAAVEACTQALDRVPGHAVALEMRGHALYCLGRFEDAADDFERALSSAPDHAFARSMLLLVRHCNGDWRDADAMLERLTAHVRSGEAGVEPFVFAVHSTSAADQRRCAELTASTIEPGDVRRSERQRRSRLRVAYLSADLREHATSYLIAELLELHDRTRFDVCAVSWCPEEPSAIRARVKRGCDVFVDAQQWSEDAIANWLREHEVDVAVDLMGYVNGARPAIFARRAAPIQVNYLGYPGTLGTSYHDYLVADEVVIPRSAHEHYSEKVVYLPDSYQPNDRQRRIAAATPTRAQAGLPEAGFVFCSFNATYKITPAVFDVWMRLLREAEGSVLWLLSGPAAAAVNLRREAEARGVAGERLVFAPRMELSEHLARHRLADLFLDTLPCNAHTTASDALWAGLPVVTCLGETFAGRVAASLLRAAGMSELCTRSLGEYEALALKLAREPSMLRAAKAGLAAQRDTCALFDSARVTRHLEAAYATMWERYQRGEPPAAFSVAPLTVRE
jgi:predicted O-linked N-acetylglucosamine transferase (SPINDLY family)